MTFLTRSLTTLLLASALSAGVAMLPVAPFGAHPAWPKSDGGGGGNGGGNGNGGGHGKGDASVGPGGSDAAASAGTNFDPNSGKGGGPKGGKGSANSKGTKGSTLGALNAAHASANALAHASPNSRVGKVAAYKDAINALNIANANLAACAGSCPDLAALTAAQATAQQNAAQALANAANKSISTATVVGVDNLLGVSLTAPTTAADLAAQAHALQ